MVYYGLCPQREDQLTKDENVNVFVYRQTVLNVMRAMKGARFKGFSTREEAETFSKGINTVALIGASHASLENANEYPTPRNQDLASKLRTAVEQGDQIAFMKLVLDACYLIGSGDNPTILHIGCHYNPTHSSQGEPAWDCPHAHGHSGGPRVYEINVSG